jgi:hypothetical protein
MPRISIAIIATAFALARAAQAAAPPTIDMQAAGPSCQAKPDSFRRLTTPDFLKIFVGPNLAHQAR